jgi:preprotein translocase subunit SecE
VPDKSGKPNVFQRWAQRFRQLIQETIGELRKVSWPTRQEAWNLTIVVLVVITIMAIFLGTLDLVYSQFFKLLLGA